MRSEFEKYFKENHADSFYSVDAALEMRGDDYIDFHAADLWALWQHQQSKIDELQKRVDACQKLLEKWKTTGLNGTSDYAVGGAHARQNCEDELEQALKGGDQ